MSASLQNLQVPFDPTGYASISGAQIKQLLDGLDTYVDKGLIIITSDVGGVPDVPDAITNKEWQRYIWLRKLSNGVTPYVWNSTAPDNIISTVVSGLPSSANMLQWYTVASASIGVGTITGGAGGHIAPTTVTDYNLASGIDAGKLTGTLSLAVSANLLNTSTVFDGDVAGISSNLVIQPDAVTTSKILDGAITSPKVETGVSITTGLSITKLRPSGTPYTLPRVDATGLTYADAHYDLLDPTKWTGTPLDLASAGADAYKIIRVNSAGTAFEKFDPRGSYDAGRILQSVIQHDNTSGNVATVAAPSAVLQTTGTDMPGLKVTNFIPKSTTSKIRIRVRAAMGQAGTNGYNALAASIVATGVATSGIAANHVATNYNKGYNVSVELLFEYDNTTGAAIDIYVKAFSSTATGSLDAASGYTVGGVGESKHFIEVTEYK